MQLVLFCGIQATGKSTFYQQRFFHSHVRRSLDLLRPRPLGAAVATGVPGNPDAVRSG
jgi:hypothetical protein